MESFMVILHYMIGVWISCSHYVLCSIKQFCFWLKLLSRAKRCSDSVVWPRASVKGNVMYCYSWKRRWTSRPPEGKQRYLHVIEIEQTNGNALLWCNITVSAKNSTKRKKKKEKKRKENLQFVNIFTENFMKLYFCLLYFEFIIHVLCTFLCAVLITGLCGICVVGCFSWLHCFDVRGRHARRGVAKGKHKTLLFSVISSVFQPWFLFGFVKQYRILLFVRLMKTIHVNITSKKNVYFYDFWVITLSFANKIFNDNLLGLVASWFGFWKE